MTCKHGPHLLDGNNICICGAQWAAQDVKDAIDAPGGAYPGQPVWWDDEEVLDARG